MILADKIITLRKKNGWSQEELAEKMDVSRQAISKWEGAQAIPDIDKILKLSQIFGVTTDFLIKEDQEIEEYTDTIDDYEDEDNRRRKVTLDDANTFLNIMETNSVRTAIGVFLCIISPIALLLLAGASDTHVWMISEGKAAGIGLILLFALVSTAVGLFVSNGIRSREFEFLEKEIFETEYGVAGMVKERKAAYSNKYSTANIIGTVLCVISVIPIFLAIAIDEENEFLAISAVCLLLFLVAIGVFFFTIVGCKWGAMQKLLQEGDYSKKKKKISKEAAATTGIYWSVVTAAYLAVSFITNRWDITWVIWPVAGVLSGAVKGITDIVNAKQ